MDYHESNETIRTNSRRSSNLFRRGPPPPPPASPRPPNRSSSVPKGIGVSGDAFLHRKDSHPPPSNHDQRYIDTTMIKARSRPIKPPKSTKPSFFRRTSTAKPVDREERTRPSSSSEDESENEALRRALEISRIDYQATTRANEIVEEKEIQLALESSREESTGKGSRLKHPSASLLQSMGVDPDHPSPRRRSTVDIGKYDRSIDEKESSMRSTSAFSDDSAPEQRLVEGSTEDSCDVVVAAAVDAAETTTTTTTNPERTSVDKLSMADIFRSAHWNSSAADSSATSEIDRMRAERERVAQRLRDAEA